jgi:hypothetical protein
MCSSFVRSRVGRRDVPESAIAEAAARRHNFELPKVPDLLHPLNIPTDGQVAFAGRDRLTIAGPLGYQACDHKACFIPESAPLSHDDGL